MSSPSATLTVWAASWLAGDSAPDDVIDALAAWAPMHLIGAADADTASALGLDWPGITDGGAPMLLRVLRRAGNISPAELRLVLPAAGDVRGLPARTDFADAALFTGQGVLVGEPGSAGFGLVPVVEGPDVLRWTVYSVPNVSGPAEHIGLGEAEYSMREAVRNAAAALLQLQTVPTGTPTDDARARIADALSEHAHHRYPESLSSRALRVLDSADQVAAILTVAEHDSTNEAPSVSAIHARESMLRPLWAAVRSARMAAAASVATHHPASGQ
ncbi:hypothetical protein [Rhodococcus sp. IEGM 1379]|uniref:hypothetical protein n=1 Tax=Rhodococcus sp. IEGM 1379 TaxID=3047086 RepID=UPI0024B76D5E|nr:hypothetical protein [Rhodococcus sp. IEGM 1379]MDI9913826.1 hypothetical protein [Rhodococcus sp. IEGM 1379]